MVVGGQEHAGGDGEERANDLSPVPANDDDLLFDKLAPPSPRTQQMTDMDVDTPAPVPGQFVRAPTPRSRWAQGARYLQLDH